MKAPEVLTHLKLAADDDMIGISLSGDPMLFSTLDSHYAPMKDLGELAVLLAAAPTMAAALQCPELDAAHDALSAALENPDAGNDEVRDAALRVAYALNAHHESRRQALLAAGFTEEEPS